MLKKPILQAKELSGQENADEALQLFMRIFDIKDRVKEESNKEKHNKVITLEQNKEKILQQLKNVSTH
ncbi:hypothetical protein JCM21714_1664 [Gracilibacillus boraciitolerans JCM 21714]|uniref:Glutamyl-tRNA reductase n=1 Tax=Gracilibacillus boraciitolerans JCM 21714 TaxID=1298598 RepID=W4VIR9_9BACI|nr:hypothetical protein JCM21714_1664 [Gracilibacillus boraciitolerans JCM 21714]